MSQLLVNENAAQSTISGPPPRLFRRSLFNVQKGAQRCWLDVCFLDIAFKRKDAPDCNLTNETLVIGMRESNQSGGHGN